MEISGPFSPRKCRCQNQKSRLCSFVSLNVKGKCAKTLPHIVRWSTKSLISKFWDIWEWIHCEAKIVPQQVDTMTVCPHLEHFPSCRFWQKNYHCLGIPCLHTRSHSVCLLPVPYHEQSSQGIRFWNHGGNSEGCHGCSRQLSEELLLKVLWQFETVLIFMYSCRRKWFGRRPVQFRIKLIQCSMWVTVSIYQTLYYCTSLICVFNSLTGAKGI